MTTKPYPAQREFLSACPANKSGNPALCRISFVRVSEVIEGRTFWDCQKHNQLFSLTRSLGDG